MPTDPGSDSPSEVDVAAFYRFVRLTDPPAFKRELDSVCSRLGLRGTILLAPEGFNATVAGSTDAVDTLIETICRQTGSAELRVHRSHAAAMPFRRMKIRLKREIVSLGVDGIDPASRTGEHVSPQRWNALLADPETLVIDVRNDYEVRIGSFDGAISPETGHFREFDRFVDAQLERLRARPVAMFCTGGIRCEKASALLLERGVERVYQLEGGILSYLSSVAPEQSAWHGDCFVFDQRVAVDAALQPADYEQCAACRRPVSAADRALPGYVSGVSCPACSDSLSVAQRRAFTERKRQVDLATARGEDHLGAASQPVPPSGKPA